MLREWTTKRARAARSYALEVARRDVPVLLLGETGTGKTELGRQMHAVSPRAARQLVEIDGSTLTDSDIATAELIGYMRGAFSNAFQSYAGAFERANGSNLLMDEIHCIATNAQAQCLRPLDNPGGVVKRWGSDKVIQVDVRLIACTSWPVDFAVEHGLLWPDLAGRLGLRIVLPALRECREDLPRLVQVMADRYAVEKVEPGALLELQRHPLPRNMHNLRTVMQVHAGTVATRASMQRALTALDDDMKMSPVKARHAESRLPPSSPASMPSSASSKARKRKGHIKERKAKRLREAARQSVDENGKLNFDLFCANLSVSKSTGYRSLRWLEKQGDLEHCGRGLWKLAS